MIKHLKNLTASMLVLLMASCAAIQPGQDKVLVNAERTTVVAYNTFDALFKLESDNRAVVMQYAPEVHRQVNNLKKHAPDYLKSARTMTETYRLNRSTENRFNLDTAMAVLTAAMREAQSYSTQITQKKFSTNMTTQAEKHVATMTTKPAPKSEWVWSDALTTVTPVQPVN